MNTSIIRYAKRGPTHTAQPNETYYCVGCDATMPNGYLIQNRNEILNAQGVFICDRCLEKAKHAARVGGGRV